MINMRRTVLRHSRSSGLALTTTVCQRAHLNPRDEVVVLGSDSIWILAAGQLAHDAINDPWLDQAVSPNPARTGNAVTGHNLSNGNIRDSIAAERQHHGPIGGCMKDTPHDVASELHRGLSAHACVGPSQTGRRAANELLFGEPHS